MEGKQVKRRARARLPLAEVFRRLAERPEFQEKFATNKVNNLKF
jgi:hypothetical protein